MTLGGALVGLLLAASLPSVRGCTILAVGKKATVDGSALLAHTDDAGGDTSDIRLVRVPAMDHGPHAKRAVYEFAGGYPRLVAPERERGPHYAPVHGQQPFVPLGFIPQASHTYAYFDMNYGLTNEVGLSLAESTAAAKTVGWPRNVPHGHCLFNINELSKVALERCATARCAIQTMGDMAVEYGFYSSFNGEPSEPFYDDSAEVLGVMDASGELWIFHVMTGAGNASAIWAAQRIPDDSVMTAPNTFVIREIDFADSARFMYSANVKDLAKEKGWWNPNEPFDFTKAYTNPNPIPVIPLYDGRRMWRIYDLVAPSLHLDATIGFLIEPGRPVYPFSVVPDKKVHVTDVTRILRDHYEGTPYDLSQGLAAGPFHNPVRYDGIDGDFPRRGPRRGEDGAWERPISVHRAAYSVLMQTRPKQPEDLSTIMWLGLDAPHGTVYVPFYSGQTTIPAAYLEGKQSEFNQKSAYWAFNFINNWSYLMYSYIHRDVVAEQTKLEEAGHAFVAKTDAAVAKLKGDRRVNYIERHQTEFAESVVAQWWALAWRLVAKYNNGYITLGEKRGDMLTPGYPVWWLRIMKYDKWPGKTWAKQSPAPSATQREVVIDEPALSLSQLTLVGVGAMGMFVAMRFTGRRRQYETLP